MKTKTPKRRSAPRGSVRAFAPGSVANLGVGFDALGVAVDGPGDVVTARLARHEGVRILSIEGDDGRLPLDPARNTAAVAAREVLADARRKGHTARGIDLVIEKGLPLASGLGSSAASAVAAAWATALLLGVKEKKALLRPVLVAENAADGAWHGDNAFSSLLGGIVLVPSSDPRGALRPVSLPVPSGLRFVLVHPELELPTAEARSVLPRSVLLGEQVKQGAAFAALVAALHAADLKTFGQWVSSDRIVEPARAPLVPGYAAVMRAMRRAGAYGVALAGAGPTLLAVSEQGARPETIAKAAVAAWAAEGIRAEARVHHIDVAGARQVGPG